MRKKVVPLIVFVCSLAALWISANLFYNMGIYVDEHNTTPSVVYGGNFWLIMSWLRLGLLGIITVVSGIQLVKKIEGTPIWDACYERRL